MHTTFDAKYKGKGAISCPAEQWQAPDHKTQGISLIFKLSEYSTHKNSATYTYTYALWFITDWRQAKSRYSSKLQTFMLSYLQLFKSSKNTRNIFHSNGILQWSKKCKRYQDSINESSTLTFNILESKLTIPVSMFLSFRSSINCVNNKKKHER